MKGPVVPKNFVKETPSKLQAAKKRLFQEDNQKVVTESDEDDSIISYADKVTTKKQKFQKVQKVHRQEKY